LQGLQEADKTDRMMTKRRSIAQPHPPERSSVSAGSGEDFLGRRGSILANSGISMGGAFKTLLLAKRMSKRFSFGQGSRRKSSMSGSDGVRRPQVRLEPTYRLEPKQKFDAFKVKLVIQDLLNRKLETFSYNPKLAAIYARTLSEELKARVKELGYERYKIIATIFIIENGGQSQEVCSRYLWDTKLDTYASYTYKNQKITCVASVYGVYHD